MDMDPFIDWAIEMLQFGYDTPQLLILAGLPKPTSFFETIPYVKGALNELRQEQRADDPAIVRLTGYIKEIAQDKDIEENLGELYVCYYGAYDKYYLLLDFFLLYLAWYSLMNSYSDDQNYWPGAKSENIRNIVVQRAKLWLEENNAFLKTVVA
ncbi:hypothetical protein DF182_23155 [Chitinophaga flava]|uniref:Uncharacterized protein n=2 Tax=Chitinophaga flava TaxID=2259036 RepID=A0A365XSU2_9BACT|nr:hypothetical protein DF182_23155 [Chitinophaga flava]